MAYTKHDLLSALEKLGSIEFTEAEAEAMADLFAEDEVQGFMPARRDSGAINDHIGAYNFKVEIEGVTQGAFKDGSTRSSFDTVSDK